MVVYKDSLSYKRSPLVLVPVIEFGDSYKVPTSTDPDDTTRRDAEQSGRTVTFTTEDMQKKKNDVKARTTLLLSLPDEHQLRFSKYKTAKELWAAILKTFGDYALWEVIKNDATLPKTKVMEGVTTKMPITTAEEKAQKRLEASKTYESVGAFGENLLQEDVNQKLLRSLSLEWNTHVVVWRSKADLDTMSMNDLYNNLKLWCHVMVLVDMTRVIRQRKGQIMHSWFSHLHVLTQRSGGHRPHGAPMRPLLRSSGHRPHRGSMRPSYRSAGHRPHGPSMNPRRPTM
nr:hypothetical protein [Tanacetum cinerariifolium]